jgi:hypothetical protein
MGRIDRNNGKDKTIERQHIKDMLANIEEYEQVSREQ